MNMNLVFLGTVLAITLASTEGYEVGSNVTETENKLCSYGYMYVGERNECKPSCDDKECIFGRCVSPGKCECLPGFHKKFPADADTNSCVPDKQFCKTDCLTSRCIENDDCLCHNDQTRKWAKTDSSECGCSKGKKVIEDNKPTCTCDLPCLNGKCIKPNECSCLPGYNKTVDPFECEPICSYFNCTQDICIVPHKCDCPSDYTRKEPQNVNILMGTSMNMAHCIRVLRHNATEQTEKPTAEITVKLSEVRPWFLVTGAVFLFSIVFGSLAISFACNKNRRLIQNANNRVRRDLEGGRNVTIDSEDTRSDFSVKYLHNEIKGGNLNTVT
ncbi:hypothetical protein GE061_016559 [Apolygus lucorum]|uniref:EGF-like domain-containing protein n=1 Tax=Apolygus lucorum TaxID=248454 RepID=A0A8S9XHP9_APOLU|nr:hypothetical protein GE061_016559 [Apolygus lucorum]